MSTDIKKPAEPPAGPAKEAENKARAPVPASASRAAQRQKLIGQGLQRLFKDVVDEPIPPEFLALLEKLDKQGNDDPEGGARGPKE